ncbi:MAG: transglutaminase family protein [Candidatus Methylomirabilaceae bacterium]
MRYALEYCATLVFPSPVREHHCELRLQPRDDAHQRVHAIHIDTDPEAELYTYIDGFGNRVHHFCLLPPHDRLVIRSTAEVETLLTDPFHYVPVPSRRERAWIADRLQEHPRLWDYVLHRRPTTPDLDGVHHGLDLPHYDPDKPLLELVQATMTWIAAVLMYQPGITQVHSPLEEALGAGAGVCQDFAHLLIALVRSWGFPARYVVGYLDPGYGEAARRSVGQAPHAWAEVLIPGAGWRGFDATARLLADETYIAVAVGRDSADAAPQRGSFKGEDEGKPPDVTLAVMRQQ